MEWFSLFSYNSHNNVQLQQQQQKNFIAGVNCGCKKIVIEKMNSLTIGLFQANPDRIKIVPVGDGAVGKTSIIWRYGRKEIPPEHEPTVVDAYT